ncbi:hypothetical protein G6F37_011260 [Rhizopus arrhizus]|nr:hypothetical protein G6F38_011197 [Rhizopus arrhizus]KAG1150189.1 hypothetical protein G6F37_011260 [Rhizopus arrhizus]
MSLKITSTNQGPGLWRLNPSLVKNERFISKLQAALESFQETIHRFNTPQDTWEGIKALVKNTARSFGILNQLLPQIESQIGNLQNEIAANNILRAGKHWREHGETSAGYLKRKIQTRAVCRHISSLKQDEESTPTSDPTEMKRITQGFYTRLYAPDAPVNDDIETLLGEIPTTTSLTEAVASHLMTSVTITELLKNVHHCPNSSSLGKDGIPYEMLRFLLAQDSLQPIILQVYNEALTLSKFPASWTTTCTVLLPKKGDPTLLRNWRPISLINSDAKVFSRILANRITFPTNRLISPMQSGFLPRRFIGDNGLTVQLIKAEAERRSSTEIGLLLDQEKAYDRVHPEHLSNVMIRLGFPSQLVDSIISLFFTTRIQVNLNGFLTHPLTQQRGLRQRDSLSPVLFNIAFDPFLRSLANDDEFPGFSFSSPVIQGQQTSPPPPVKLLAYADDVIVFLTNPLDFTRLTINTINTQEPPMRN